MAPSAIFSCSSCSTSSTCINLPLFSSNFSKKPTTTTTTTLLKITNCQNQCQPTNNWAPLTSEVSTHIIKHLPKTPPPSITDPMHRLISAAPPSVASAICLAACQLVCGEKSRAMSAASAVQLMHAAAHAHTQLPSCLSGVDLMASDGLFLLGYQMAAACPEGGDCDPETAVRVVLELARAMGPRGGTVEGLMMMMMSEGETYWAWERKGGRMAACGAACGAIVGRGSEEEVERLRRFGMYVGMVNEIMMMMNNNGTAGAGDQEPNSYVEVIQMLRSLARLELRGFDKERVDDVVGFFQLDRQVLNTK